MNKIMIIGSGGFAREIIKLIADINRVRAAKGERPYTVIGCISNETGKSFVTDLGTVSVIGDDEWAWGNLPSGTLFVAGIGNPLLRKQVASGYLAKGFRAVALVHPSVGLSSTVKVGEGAIVCEGAKLTVDVSLGAHCVLNLNATVGHDCKVEDFAVVHPGVQLSGNVAIGECSEIGTGAVVLPGISIGKNAVVGAGAVVTRDVADGQKVMGVPAK